MCKWRGSRQTNRDQLESIEGEWAVAIAEGLREDFYGELVVRMTVADGVIQKSKVEVAREIRIRLVKPAG